MKSEKLQELVAEQDLQTDLWWLAMALAGFLAAFLAAFGYPGAGSFWVWLSVAARLSIAVGVAQEPWGKVFRALLMFGLAAGVFAIFGDWLLVNWQERGRRVYFERGGAALLESPLYLPLIWACAFVESGYAIVRIYGLARRHLSPDKAAYAAMAAGGLIAAIWTACMDFWAVKAGWWTYKEGEGILGGSALYVVIATALIHFAFLPLFSRFLDHPGGRTSALTRYGAIMGVVIFVSYVAAHALVERRL